MLKKWIALLSTFLFVLTACHSPLYNQTEGNIADVKLKSAAARQKSDDSAKTQPSLLVKQGLYVDTTPINLEREPSWLHNHIVIRGDQLPFSYYSRTVAMGAGSMILTKYQVGLSQTDQLSLNYSGTVKGALEVLASKTGYVYTVRRNTIYWQAFVTKTFDVAFLPGGTEYLMGKSSGGGGAGGSTSSTSTNQNYTSTDDSSSEYSNLKGTLSVWKDLADTIKQLLSKDGSVTVSQATTTVTVHDRPTNVALIGQFISNLNSNLSRQVLVKIQVLEVDLSNEFDYGINWQMIVKAFHNSPFMVNGNYGTPITITPFTTQSAIGGLPVAIPPGKVPLFGTAGAGLPSYTILLNALNQQGKTSLVSEPRVVCLNNQVSVVRIVTTEGYVASVQNTTLASGGTAPTSTVTSQVTPGSITTGLTLYVLPKILGKKIYMQVNADLSLKKALISFGTAGSEVQLPTIGEKHFNQRSVIESGDTLILSGFRQVGNQAKASQMLESQSLGGKAAVQANTETVILITPIILNGGPA